MFNRTERPKAVIEAAYEQTMRILTAWKVKREQVEFCPVDRSAEGTLIYRRFFDSGNDNPHRWAYRPISWARYCDRDFIGYVFDDGNVRRDAEILVSMFTGHIDLPRHVAFYRRTVPLNERKALSVRR